MGLHISAVGDPNGSYGTSIVRLLDGLLCDFSDAALQTFSATPTTEIQTLTAGSGNSIGEFTYGYTSTLDTTVWIDGLFRVRIHDLNASNQVVGSEVITIVGGDDLVIPGGASVAAILAGFAAEVLAFRDLSNVSAPTWLDALAAAWCAGAGSEQRIGNKLVKLQPDNASTLASFTSDDPDRPTRWTRG